jgi:hypothetical protein
MRKIDSTSVLALARVQGHDWIDEAAAQSIAAGATAAVAAVTASLRQLEPGLLVADSGEFLATLEALAEPGT